MKHINKLFFISFLMLLFNSCKGFLSIEPPKDQITANQVFENDATAESAIIGVYGRMINTTQGFISGGFRGLAYLSSLSADELIEVTPGPFYSNQLLPNNSTITTYIWTEAYNYIYTVNSILERLAISPGISNSVKTRLEGEAKFVRSLCYFYLVNLFGDIPLHLFTDYRINSMAKRQPIADVYRQIIKDLLEAENLLDDDYFTSERIRPNKWAAKALLSRTYLYSRNWKQAEAEATAIIEKNNLYRTESLDRVFLKTSMETIWQLKPVVPTNNTFEAGIFIIQSNPVYASLSNTLLAAFEQTDLRRNKWVGTYSSVNTGILHFPYKYKTTSGASVEYSIVLRLSEQYLIRAEAKAQQNDLDGARQDLFELRNRAGLNMVPQGSQQAILTVVEHERQVELFTEGGHRWLDLKRTGRADEVLKLVKFPGWQETDERYPIPLNEINRNPNMTQNNGYK